MPSPRASHCAGCGASVLWLAPYGFGEPRPVEPAAVADGDVVIDGEEGRYRYVAPGRPAVGPRFRLHWPCPAGAPARDHGAAPAPSPGPARRPLEVSVVAHTHWDREWYDTFEGFRARLVDVVDGVLDALESDPRFVAFHLDGHTAVVDDYLAARPEAGPRVRRLVAAGRLVVGPWETLADEFLVSGETLVRDLQRGMRRARQLGRAMAVGYLPDQFGHTAQLPQVLALAGIGHALVFRGVPDDLGATRFRWEAPDGTGVWAEHLPAGYTNAERFEDDAKRIVDRALDTEVMLGDRLAGALLLMRGGDHQAVDPAVPGVLARANALQPEVRFALRTLEDHLAGQPVEGLPTWRGELRAPGAATVTPGVASNRVDVRLATAAAERAVERRAEPLAALHLPAREWPGGLLDLAWGHLVANAAHDSIAACSADEVVQAVLRRARDARTIGERVAARALAALAAAVAAPAGALVVANPSAHPRRGVVEAWVPGAGPCHLVAPDGTALPTQAVGAEQRVEVDVTAGGDGLDAVLGLIGPDRVAGWRVAEWSLDEGDGRFGPTATLVLTAAGAGEAAADLGPALDRLAAWRAEPGRTARVVLLRPARRAVLALADVPGFGWSTLEVVDGPGPPTAVSAGPGWVANEHLRVEAEGDGGLRVTTADGMTLAGLGRLVDGGDAGDVYDWSPPADDVLVDTPGRVEVETVESGPVRARMVVRRRYRWPARLERPEGGAAAPGDRLAAATRRSAATEVVEVRTVVDVVAGERLVRLTVELDNTCRDHRLRLHLPLPAPVTGSWAESAFAVTDRPLTGRGNPLEAAQGTFPSARFVDCSDGAVGLGVVHDGAAEYEVVGGGRELAVTLLRSVGWLSRADNRTRRSPAGPALPLEGAQVQGRLRRRLALVPHRGGWQDAGLPLLADEVLLPLEVAGTAGGVDAPGQAAGPAGGGTGLAPTGSRLSVRGADVSALLRRDGALELRVVRLSPTAGVLEVDLGGRPAQGRVVDLHGAGEERFEGRLPLRPWQVATVRLESP